MFKKKDYMQMIGDSIKKVLMNKKYLIIFFGSIVKEDFNRASDIDVAIYCKGDISGREYLRILNELDNLPILRKIDLHDISTIKDKDFLMAILQEGKIWSGSKELLKDLIGPLRDMKK